MVKVLDKVKESSIVLIFIILMILATMYMSVSERKLENNSNNNPIILNIK